VKRLGGKFTVADVAPAN